MRSAAQYFASLPAGPAVAAPPGSDLVARGRAVAKTATPGAPSCASCHGPWPTDRARLYPDLAGQYEGYLLDQLNLWKQGRRGGTALAHLMQVVVAQLEEEDLAALAAYYASLRRPDRRTLRGRGGAMARMRRQILRRHGDGGSGGVTAAEAEMAHGGEAAAEQTEQRPERAGH